MSNEVKSQFSKGLLNRKSYQEVQKLKPIDDVFFEKLIEDKNVCEEILRIILEDDKLEVLWVTPQRSLKNLQGRSVRLDALCKLGNEQLCNIEVQKSNNDDHVRRVRYNAACITANNTDVNEKFINVPDVTMVYISIFDMFNKGKTIYHCKTVIEETGDAVDNGLKEIYVNTKIDDGSTIAELMKCFMQEQVDNKKFPMLSKSVWYYKNDEGGIEAMCKIVEDYANEVATKKSAEEIVNAVESIMKNFKLSVEEACDGLNYTLEKYNNAKSLIS